MKHKQGGFSLLEVMIAMTVFSVFVAVYVTSQGYNISDSTLMREELMLQTLCETKINEIIISPPELRDSLTLSKETKTFEDYEEYEYSIEYKKFILPDFKALMNSEDSEEEEENSTQQMIMEKVKENMEKIIWQITVEVRNKQTDFNFKLSTWLYNHKTSINLGSF